ncbi:MAG: hypothetical protein M1817_004147 [Caeruleum heppii]|nr:MAG: hypothetical protein M1817_004147 [Caeruleum heppii]
MLVFILAVATIVVTVWWSSQSASIRRHGQRLPRPPGTLPLLGNGLLFLQARHKLLHWFTQCGRQYEFETFEIFVPTLPRGVVINDPANLEYVLKNDDLFSKGEFFRSRSWDLFGNGIINVDGALWKSQRKAALPFFGTANLKTIIDDVLPHIWSETRQSLERQAATHAIVDMADVFLELTTRLMGRLAYDMDLHASHPFSEAFEIASGAIGERFQNPLWKVKEALWGAAVWRAFDEVHRFGKCIVVRASEEEKASGLVVEPEKKYHSSIDKNQQPDRRSASNGGANLIDALKDELESPKHVADSALNFLSAGRDTLAQALTWTLHLLMEHPSVAERVMQEMNASGLENEESQLDFGLVQPHSMPYTLAVFSESLRLYPPVPVEIKQCISSTILPDGTVLPTGAVVVWCPWSFGRSWRIWGDDADVFRPERWLDKIPASAPGGADRTGIVTGWRVKTKTAYEFPVFNGGARTCLGRKMAEFEAVYIIASLLRTFEMTEIKDNRVGGHWTAEGRVSKNSLTLPMDGGLPCLVKLRRHES